MGRKNKNNIINESNESLDESLNESLDENLEKEFKKDLQNEELLIINTNNINESVGVYNVDEEVKIHEDSFYKEGVNVVNDNVIKGDTFELIQNSFLTFIRDELYKDDDRGEETIANDNSSKTLRIYIDDLKGEIHSLQSDTNVDVIELSKKERALSEAQEDYDNTIRRHSLAIFEPSFAVEQIEKFAKTNLKNELLTELYTPVNKDTVISTFKKYLEPVKTICDKQEELLSENANNKRSNSLTYLENDIYDRLNGYNKKNKDKFRKYSVKDKNIVKEFAISLTDGDVQIMLTHSFNNIIGTSYNLKTYTKEFTDNLIDPDKTSVRGNTLDKKELLESIRALKGMDDIVSAKPWYKKIFNKNHTNQRKILDNAKQALIDRGVDKKSLEKYLSSEGNEILLNAVWTKSKNKIQEFNKAIEAKEEQLNEDINFRAMNEQIKVFERKKNKNKNKINEIDTGMHIVDDLEFDESDVEEFNENEKRKEFNDMLKNNPNPEKDFKDGIIEEAQEQEEVNRSDVSFDDSLEI